MMAKIMIPAMVVVAVGLVTVTEHSLASEYLLEIIADDNGDITSVRDGDNNDLKKTPFKKIEDFDLILTKSLLFSYVPYLFEGNLRSCCKRGGSWRWCPWMSKTLINDAGEVVGEYNLVGGEWRKAEYMDEVHTSAVIRPWSHKSHVFAVIRKKGKLYGILITDDKKIWYNPQSGITLTVPKSQQFPESDRTQ